MHCTSKDAIYEGGYERCIALPKMPFMKEEGMKGALHFQRCHLHDL